MDTRRVAKELRLRHWAGIMQARQESGQSIRSWCGDAGMSEKTYYYWQRKLREAACQAFAGQEALPEESLTPVTPVSWARIEPGLPESAIAVEINGCCVQVTANTDLALLMQVCRALKAL